MKGQVESQGPVLIGPEAEVKGDVKAPTLAVGAGAVLEGQYKIGWKDDEPADPTDAAPPADPTDRSEQDPADAPDATAASAESAPTTATKSAPPTKIPPPPKRDPSKPSPFKTFPTKKPF